MLLSNVFIIVLFFITLLFSIYLPFSYSKDSSLVFPFQLCFVFSLFSFSFYLFPTHSFFFSNNKFKRVNVISFSCGKFSVWRQKTNLRFIRIPLISWDRVRRIRWDVRGVTHCEKWRSVVVCVFFGGKMARKLDFGGHLCFCWIKLRSWRWTVFFSRVWVLLKVNKGAR